MTERILSQQELAEIAQLIEGGQMAVMSRDSMRTINNALDWLSPDPFSPDWTAVQVLTRAINELERLRIACEAWEKWEADLLDTAECWDTEDGLPKLNQDLYDRWGELQELRNEAFGGYDARWAEVHQEGVGD